MKLLQSKYGLLVLGVITGVAYGLIARWLYEERALLASVTFLFVVPAILGIIPLIFANKEQLRTYKNVILIPWLTVAAFFGVMLLIGLEGILCLLILAAPFFLLATLAVFIVRLVLLHKEKNKGRLMVLMILPFLLAPIEDSIKKPSAIYKVESIVIISAAPETIWNNIVEVKPIHDKEYVPGILNEMGIPRPVSATVDRKEKGGHRIGNFEGGLKFHETITRYEPFKTISFDIKVDPKSVRNEVFDQHVLNGNYFAFVDATYDIEPLANGEVKLKLSSNYQMTSTVNLYGKFWGDIILKDFQDRLLQVIEKRCEGKE